MKSNIPKIGFGTYRLKGETCFNAVTDALSCGYKLLDTAEVYDNEEQVGKAISSSSIPRENLFISSKLWFPYKNIEKSVLQSCNRLKLDYIDLYLIHKPNSIMHSEHLNAFMELRNCKDKGLIRSIGVTSFTLEELNELVFITGIIPDLVQVECHPFLQQKALQERVESLGSTFQAWFPLGSGDQKLFNNPILKSIALSHHVTVPAIILAWHIQEGHSVVVRSTKINHMKDNLNVGLNAIVLSSSEMEQIRSLDRNKSYMPLPGWVQTLYFKSPFGRFV